MKMLLEQETYSCGTTRANRKNWPTEFRKPTVLKLKMGKSRKMQHEDVTAVVWQNKSVVLLSTNYDPQTDGELSVAFSVQGTGDSPTGPGPENSVGYQDIGSSGRAVSSECKCQVRRIIVVQEQDHLGDLSGACIFLSKHPSIGPAEMSNTPRW